MNPLKTAALPVATLYPVLFTVSLVHLLNDSIQSVIPAIFPIIQRTLHLSYFELGCIAFANNFVASIMQPLIGWYTDKNPLPYLLPVGMAFTLFGMLALAFSFSLGLIILSVTLVGVGSAIFHPEASRVVVMAAGQRRGLSQSIFQVGGNAGQSLAPIMTALIFVPLGQFGAVWFTLIAAIAFVLLLFIANWNRQQLQLTPLPPKTTKPVNGQKVRNKKVGFALFLIVFLVFVRAWYGAGITNYYAFYLIENYGLTIKDAQFYIFLFLIAGAAGTFSGGPLSDRFGKKNVIIFSVIASAPLSILLPFVSLAWTYPLLLLNGFIILSSFSVTLVYALELIPGKIGAISGMVFGLSFGMAAIGAISLGGLADILGLKFIMVACGFLPALGIVTFLLPSEKQIKQWHASSNEIDQ
jgi:FSR family fosmidomycin resistance protein-like MFS transporter